MLVKTKLDIYGQDWPAVLKFGVMFSWDSACALNVQGLRFNSKDEREIIMFSFF